jgi:beta-glucanase (GH16 family)
MIDPSNLAGTAKLTYSNEFNSLNWWNGTSGLDFAPGWHVAYNPNSTGFNAGDNDTWNINPNFEGTKSANTFMVNNGILTLTAKPTDPAIAQYTNGFKYTGGQVSTFHEFSQTYGYFEMRAKLPAESGLGSAFWLLNADMKWPPEIDVMESIGRDPTAIFNTAHSGDANSTHTAVGSNANGPIYSNQSWSRVTDMSADFHTYGLNWQADKITWYMDGQKLFEMNTPADMHKPMYLLAGVGVSNNDWVGYASPTTTGQMQIDYLRAYSNAPTTPMPDPTNRAPSNVLLTGNDVLENSVNGTVLGTLSASDADGDTVNFNLLDNAGGRFALSGNKLVVANGGLLDYEQATSHQISVRVTDSHGASVDQTFNVTVRDVLDEMRTGTSGNDQLVGGIGPDNIDGKAGNDSINGTAGDDRINGGYGNDMLTGGTGKDTFIFADTLNKTKNLDTITDFSVADDSMWLENTIFQKLEMGTLSEPGMLNQGFFTIGDKAKDSNDYLIYNKTNGYLYYDADGSGKGAAVAFAKLTINLALTEMDFYIV